MLASRIRNAAHESVQAALTQATQQHEKAVAEITRHYGMWLSEVTRQHDRSVAELAREHNRLTQEFGVFSQKRHEVYAELYARYRGATHDLAATLTGHVPEFAKFSRDDLLRYLQQRAIREREAADAIGAMDRGDLFAMNKLMTAMHWRVTLRDANAAVDRAREYQALNELYFTDAVRDAVDTVRRQVEALSFSLAREQQPVDQAKRNGQQDSLHSAVTSLLHAMRDDLRSNGADGKARPRVELDRPATNGKLPLSPGLADKAPAPVSA
ncbi:MAG: hypothetical protein ACRENU_04410 [Gemmatimonadaceae bacterium]